MVEFSVFYFLPTPPLFLYDYPVDSTYITGGFHFAQIDNIQTFVRPEGLPQNYAFPVAFKVSNGMRFHVSALWSGDWLLYLSLPSIHVSTPPLGTSSLPANPPEVIWGDIDATVEDTLRPVDVDGLRSKVPVRWRIRGKITVQPVLSSESNFNYLPITFGLGRWLGDYFLAAEGSVSRFSGSGGWDIRYVGGRIYEDTFALSGIQNDAVLSFQFAEEQVGRYVYTFEMAPTILYEVGFRVGRRFGGLKVGVGAETFRGVRLEFSDSLYYDHISDLYGRWLRSEFFNNDLYAEYSADSDTVYLKGSAIVGFRREGAVWDTASTTGRHLFTLKGGTYPLLTLSYVRGNLYAAAKVSGREVAVVGRVGEEYGGFGGLDVRLKEGELSRWRLGVFYASESFVFSLNVSRAFGLINFPYLRFNVPPITAEVYAYSLGASFIWKLGE